MIVVAELLYTVMYSKTTWIVLHSNGVIDHSFSFIDKTGKPSDKKRKSPDKPIYPLKWIFYRCNPKIGRFYFRCSSTFP